MELTEFSLTFMKTIDKEANIHNHYKFQVVHSNEFC